MPTKPETLTAEERAIIERDCDTTYEFNGGHIVRLLLRLYDAALARAEAAEPAADDGCESFKAIDAAIHDLEAYENWPDTHYPERALRALRAAQKAGI